MHIEFLKDICVGLFRIVRNIYIREGGVDSSGVDMSSDEILFPNRAHATCLSLEPNTKANPILANGCAVVNGYCTWLKMNRLLISHFRPFRSSQFLRDRNNDEADISAI